MGAVCNYSQVQTFSRLKEASQNTICKNTKKYVINWIWISRKVLKDGSFKQYLMISQLCSWIISIFYEDANKVPLLMYLVNVKFDNITAILTITIHFQLTIVRIQLQHSKIWQKMMCLLTPQRLWQAASVATLPTVCKRPEPWIEQDFASLEKMVVFKYSEFGSFFGVKISAQDWTIFFLFLVWHFCCCWR